MAWDPGAGWAGPIQDDAADERSATSEEAAEEPRRPRRGLAGAQARRRARTGDGTFRADDPATPAVDEAYEEAAEPGAEAEPGKLKQRG
jgi:hypothetical protein